MTIKELREWLNYLPDDFIIWVNRDGVEFELENHEIIVNAKHREIIL